MAMAIRWRTMMAVPIAIVMTIPHSTPVECIIWGPFGWIVSTAL